MDIAAVPSLLPAPERPAREFHEPPAGSPEPQAPQHPMAGYPNKAVVGVSEATATVLATQKVCSRPCVL